MTDKAADTFEGLLAELAVGVGGDPAVDAVGDALGRSIAVLGVDAGAVTEVAEQRVRTAHLRGTREFGLPEYPAVELPWLVRHIASGDAIRVPDIAELPSDAAADREALARRGIRSLVACPIVVRAAAAGAVVFFANDPDRLNRMKLVARVLAAALARRWLEERLDDETEFAEAVLESLPGLLFVLDEQGCLVRWNRNHETVIGYSAAELLGLHYSAHTAPQDHAALGAAFEEALTGSHASAHCHLVHKDGRRMPYLASGRGVSIGGRRYVIGMGIDVSALKAAEERARRQQAELAHVARVSAMGELAAAIAHELNQPLTAIRTNAQATRRMLPRGDLEPRELDEALADITADAVRASEIIRRLRDLLTKRQTERVSLDVNELIRAVEPFARADVLEHNGALVMQLAEGLPRVAGDCIQLQQVVLNLVRNGSEAMRDAAVDRRDLVVTTALAEEAIEVTVRDGGPPLSDDDFGRMFQPFYTTKPGGLGIGLSLSRSIIEAHGGLLWATRNALADGVTMHFTLPVDKAAG